MAGLAVVVYLDAVFRAHGPSVASRATVGLLMADVVRVGVPPDLHLREHVDGIGIAERLPCRIDGIRFLCSDIGVVLLVELRQFVLDSDARCIVRLVEPTRRTLSLGGGC